MSAAPWCWGTAGEEPMNDGLVYGGNAFSVGARAEV